MHDVPIALAGPAPAIDVSASAGSTAVPQTRNGIATALGQAQGPGTSVATRDLVPLPAAPRALHGPA
ncbi:hypothetical protein AB0D45_15855 [Streptomyces sp. NPDC048352]|uniref:hypothetical protein n=1 Tax=Streptomyces sp. NPDC048352 TaxID=3154718 RepID=UPI0034214414